ncbi:hypothetical protein FB451DRAFT_1407416 [Mycena latifolia]|nr:hypothetical protein FB451DRAFT_1407416 [Mycena latifolia]
MSASTPLLPPDPDAQAPPDAWGPLRATPKTSPRLCEAVTPPPVGKKLCLWRLPLLACTVSLFPLLFNFILYLPSPSSPASSASSAPLRFPDSYPAPGADPNFPTALAPVDAAFRTPVFLEPPNWELPNGVQDSAHV